MCRSNIRSFNSIESRFSVSPSEENLKFMNELYSSKPISHSTSLPTLSSNSNDLSIATPHSPKPFPNIVSNGSHSPIVDHEKFMSRFAKRVEHMSSIVNRVHYVAIGGITFIYFLVFLIIFCHFIY